MGAVAESGGLACAAGEVRPGPTHYSTQEDQLAQQWAGWESGAQQQAVKCTGIEEDGQVAAATMPISQAREEAGRGKEGASLFGDGGGGGGERGRRCGGSGSR